MFKYIWILDELSNISLNGFNPSSSRLRLLEQPSSWPFSSSLTASIAHASTVSIKKLPHSKTVGEIVAKANRETRMHVCVWPVCVCACVCQPLLLLLILRSFSFSLWFPFLFRFSVGSGDVKQMQLWIYAAYAQYLYMNALRFRLRFGLRFNWVAATLPRMMQKIKTLAKKYEWEGRRGGRMREGGWQRVKKLMRVGCERHIKHLKYVV